MVASNASSVTVPPPRRTSYVCRSHRTWARMNAGPSPRRTKQLTRPVRPAATSTSARQPVSCGLKVPARRRTRMRSPARNVLPSSLDHVGGLAAGRRLVRGIDVAAWRRGADDEERTKRPAAVAATRPPDAPGHLVAQRPVARNAGEVLRNRRQFRVGERLAASLASCHDPGLCGRRRPPTPAYPFGFIAATLSTSQGASCSKPSMSRLYWANSSGTSA